MLKKLAAILAMTVALPAFALVTEHENNGSIPLAQPISIAGTGVEFISGAVTANPLDGRGDYDVFNLGRFSVGGSIVVTMVTLFDPFIALYNSAGELVVYNDDYFGMNSFFNYSVAAEDTYYLAILGFGSGLLTQPFNAASGGNVGSTGNYLATVAYTGAQDESRRVPEPTGLALAALAAAGVFGLRRRGTKA